MKFKGTTVSFKVDGYQWEGADPIQEIRNRPLGSLINQGTITLEMQRTSYARTVRNRWGFKRTRHYLSENGCNVAKAMIEGLGLDDM